MDTVTFEYRGKSYTACLQEGTDISIPMRSGADNPNCYQSPHPDFHPITDQGFIGSVAEGGACNHFQLTFTPHGNGTHTECYGHISADSDATIHNCLKKFHFLAQVLTVTPELQASGDRVISRSMIAEALMVPAPEAVIVRTEPNTLSKQVRDYSGSNPSYLEAEVAAYLADRRVQHLLVDLPSVDREQDGGRLEAHKAFWQFPENTRKQSTITELVYLPPEVQDGLYLLNLQIASFMTDASPSKPVIYPLK